MVKVTFPPRLNFPFLKGADTLGLPRKINDYMGQKSGKIHIKILIVNMSLSGRIFSDVFVVMYIF